MKKLTMLIVAMFLVLLFAACGDNGVYEYEHGYIGYEEVAEEYIPPQDLSRYLDRL